MERSPVCCWVGRATGMFLGIPQLVKTVSTQRTSDLSATPFILILITCAGLLVRAIAIKELAFIFYYAFLMLVNSLQLFRIWKAKDQNPTA